MSYNHLIPSVTEDITVDTITVRNAKISKAFVFDIPTIVDSIDSPRQVVGNKTVFILPGGLFLLQYNNKEDRDNNASIFRRMFQRDGFFSKQLPNGYQIPENAGEFEYNDQYYIILNTYNELTPASDTLSIQGVIIDISVYEQMVSTKMNVAAIVQESK